MENLSSRLASGGLGALGSMSGLAASGCAGQCAACLACAGVGLAALGAVIVMRMKKPTDNMEGKDGLAKRGG